MKKFDLLMDLLPDGDLGQRHTFVDTCIQNSETIHKMVEEHRPKILSYLGYNGYQASLESTDTELVVAVVMNALARRDSEESVPMAPMAAIFMSDPALPNYYLRFMVTELRGPDSRVPLMAILRRLRPTMDLVEVRRLTRRAEGGMPQA